jgi:F-box/WD-40 domain protein 7
VILATGHTYDRHSIERWLAQGHKTCPVTGMRLRHLELTPNFALRSAIVEWGQQHGVKLPERVKQQAVQPVFKWDESRAGNILQVGLQIVLGCRRSCLRAAGMACTLLQPTACQVAAHPSCRAGMRRQHH